MRCNAAKYLFFKMSQPVFSILVSILQYKVCKRKINFKRKKLYRFTRSRLFLVQVDDFFKFWSVKNHTILLTTITRMYLMIFLRRSFNNLQPDKKDFYINVGCWFCTLEMVFNSTLPPQRLWYTLLFTVNCIENMKIMKKVLIKK